ncbi:MAG: response regulator transcription factor [Bryobacterales bacterium]|nr:response regulator transcription factor [Bryobacterales bacterium]
MSLRVYLVDDEELALRRLHRLLTETARVEIVGSATDPVQAQQEIELLAPDALFLDIQMPELTGFQLLAGLAQQPLVIFTTAYDQYALRAFEVNSVDYLLKPIDDAMLDRALTKLERMAGGEAPRPQLAQLLQQVSAALKSQSQVDAPQRIPARIGERVHFLELARISHFYAEDKLTYAATADKNWVIDKTITDLEQKMDPARFVRVHRSTLVNLAFVDELYPWFGGRMIVRLKDPKKTEITVARERLKELKERLGL